MSNYLLAALIAFLLCVALLFLLLPLLKRKKAGQEILEYVKEHSYKSGTPTMGGIAIILAMITAALIFGKGKFVYITLAVAFAYGVTGFLDDSIKIRYKRNLGLRPYQKIILQLSIALIVAFVVYKNELIRGDVYIPFTKIRCRWVGESFRSWFLFLSQPQTASILPTVWTGLLRRLHWFIWRELPQ